MFIWIWILTFLANNTSEMTKHHHTKTGFKNNYPIEEHGFSSLLKWQFSSIGKKGKIMPFPVEKPNVDFIKNNKSEPNLVWINHATFLLQYEGANILTDPIFSERCSPVQWAGPKRTTKPGMEISLSIKDAVEKANKENREGKIVFIEGNIVTVQLKEGKGYSYSFFNDVELNKNYHYADEGNEYNFIVEAHKTGGAIESNEETK